MKKLRKLEQEQLSALKEHKGVQTFENEIDVLKNNEVPAAAIIILEGEANVLKQQEEAIQISPGYAIGMDQLTHAEPAQLNLRAKRDLKAIILSKYDFHEGSTVYSILAQVLKNNLST